MKKHWKILLLTVVFVLITAMSVSAASSVCTADKNTVAPGDTVKFTVSLKSNEKIKSMGITPVYDPNVFDLVSGEWSVSGALLKDFDLSNKRGVVLFASEKDCSGDVFVLTLKVKDAANDVQTKIKADFTLMDKDSRDLPCGSVEAILNVVTPKSTEAETTTPAVTPETTAETAAAATAEATDKPSETSAEATADVTAAESKQPEATETAFETDTQTSEKDDTSETKAHPETDETAYVTENFAGDGIPMDPPNDNGILNNKTLIVVGVAVLVCLVLGLGITFFKKR